MRVNHRPGRKLLVASAGVAAVSYVACGGGLQIASTSSQSADAGADVDDRGTGGNVLIANLAPPERLCRPAPSGPPGDVGPSTALGLTNAEYDRTVRDLFGDTSMPSKGFQADDTYIGFKTEAIVADPAHPRVMGYVQAAGDLADANAARLAKSGSCDPAVSGEVACRDQLIASFGKRAFRRPLTMDEVAAFQKAYADGRASGTYESGARAIIFAALSSPHFYMLEEKGTPGAVGPLGPYAMASRLSYFLYRSMPDDALFAAADADKLSTAVEVAAQARRMLQDPKAHDAITDFYREWLQLDNLLGMDKSADLLPSFATVRVSMVTETTKFAESNFFERGGLYTDLLTSRKTWVDADLAAIYGEPFSGTGFQQLELGSAMRSGLLTQPSILSLTSGPEQTSPTRRGKLVRELLLCQPVAPEPSDLTWGLVIPPVMPGVTTRQRYQMLMASNPVCPACHSMMDPIGFGFEEFDAVGRFRTLDNGVPIDSSGSLRGVQDEGPFSGVADLAAKLSRSTEVPDCIALQWFRFALERKEADDEACTLESIRETFRNSQKLPDLVIAIVQSDSFRYARW